MVSMFTATHQGSATTVSSCDELPARAAVDVFDPGLTHSDRVRADPSEDGTRLSRV
jgi:hypothetical protein